MSTFEATWQSLVANKPRLASVLSSIAKGDNTLYLLSRKFGSFSVNWIIKELVEMGATKVVREDVGRNGLPKKIYGLTPLGERLLKLEKVKSA